MATKSGRPPPAIGAVLKAAPKRFRLLQAVRLLERMGFKPRFKGDAGHAFPAVEVTQLGGAGGRHKGMPLLHVGAFTLTGVTGTLPDAYTDLASSAQRDNNGGFGDFLDLFLGRLIEHFVRASRRYRLALSYEAKDNGHDLGTEALGALTGLALPSLQGRLAIDDAVVFHYAGILARRPVPPVLLEAMLGEVFAVPVRIESFVPAWTAIPISEQSRLPGAFDEATAFACLGVDAVIGDRVLDYQSRFEVVIGPLGLDAFRTWLPGSDHARALADLTRLAVGPDMGFDLRLVLDRQEVPVACLDRAGEGTRLGWDGWLITDTPHHHVDDAVFDLDG